MRAQTTLLLVLVGVGLAACTQARPEATPTAAAPRAPVAAETAPANEKAAPKGEAAPVSGGNADNGRQLFISKGCGACHIIPGLDRAAGTVGPELTHVASVAGERVPGLTAEQYLAQSEQEPGAFTVPGFQAGLMPKLVQDDAELADLVAFLLTLR